MAVAEVRQLPTMRPLAVDERGVGLRATWHLEREIVNLSCGASPTAHRLRRSLGRSRLGPTGGAT